MSVSVKASFKENTNHKATFTENSNSVRSHFDAEVHVGMALPSDDIPLMDGIASAGTDKKYSRSDHIHPHDSQKMDYMSAITNMQLKEMLK